MRGRGLDRRGEAVASVAYYWLRGGERDYQYRFLLNERGEVADFSAEPTD